VLIPTAQIDLFAELGFRLVDEPACGLARVSAGNVRRIPQKKTAQAGKPKAVKSDLHNETDRRRVRRPQDT
jgi:hypothetical protein